MNIEQVNDDIYNEIWQLNNDDIYNEIWQLNNDDIYNEISKSWTMMTLVAYQF